MPDRWNIRVLNPNSSRHVTEGIEEAVAGLSTRLNIDLQCAQLDHAPAAIETAAHIQQITPMIEADIYATPADAHIIACFSDPAVAGLRADGFRTVFGIAECAMLMAAGISGRFGIISILEASVERHREQVARTGLSSRLAGDLALDLGVLELSNEDITRRRLREIGARLTRDHGAASLVLGCAGMTGYRSWLQEELSIPVIDPCQAAVSMAVAHLAVMAPDR